MSNVFLDEKLFECCMNGNLKKIKYLVAIGADVCFVEGNKSVLEAARESGNVEVVEFLKKKIMEDFERALDKKANIGMLKELSRLKNITKDVDEIELKKLNRELYEAVSNNDVKGVSEAINNGADVNAEFNEDLVNLLLERGADVNAKDLDGWTALMHTDSVNVARMLLNRGVNVNEKSIDGETALGLSIDDNSLDMVKELIKYGADVNDKMYDYGNLDVAVSNNFWEIAEVLVDNGADVDVRNNEGFTPIMVVASSLQSRLLEKMVKKSKNIDVVDDNGRSALIKSAMCGLKENVEILLQNGANKDITDLTGWSAKDYIKLMGTTGTIVDKIMKKKFGRD